MLIHILKIKCVSNLSRLYQIASHVVKLTYLIKFLLAFYSIRIYWTLAKCQKLFLITGSIVVNIMHNMHFLKILFIRLVWVFIAVHWLSPVVVIGDCSLIVIHGFLFVVASLGVEHGL